jgi:hypothetical protein
MGSLDGPGGHVLSRGEGSMSWTIQVLGDWAGCNYRTWSPAVSGTFNQTRESDEFASTFGTRNEAERALEFMVENSATGELPRLRIVELDKSQ